MQFIFKIFLICSVVLAEATNFQLKNSNSQNAIIEFNLGDISFERKEGYHVILGSEGNTRDVGLPELPTYTFNYSIDYNYDYEVSLNENDYTIHENIDLYPSQPIYNVNQEKAFIKNSQIYNKDEIYPETKISSKRSSIRGYDLLTVELTPYEYNPKTKQLKVFNNLEVVISESNLRTTDSNRTPRSRIFENIYQNSVINNDDYQDTRSFQKPSVLYICGGNIASSPYLNPLVEWRHKQGYVVNVVSTSQTGSNTTDIKNYITNAYNNWQNPPEHVCLIGDANGSINVPTYTVYGGNGWSSAQGEGDHPYTLIEGNDLLPDLSIGRISIRSTTELITAINKIIGYEKNYSGETDWLNRMALVGDPSDSGISTIITNQYIEQIAETHGGITDIETQYGGSNYDDFMVNQINEGVAYLNYRGFYGFSNFTTNDVAQLNNGYKLSFISTITCGTGSFATETTCMTESLYRAGTSVSPRGAVAVVGTAQSYTHTAFNNIVNMGIFDGIFLHESSTAGEAHIYGKLAIDEIYPQNPNDNVYLFQTWNNLLGDPSLQLWTSVPETMVVQHNQMVINGSDNFQVSVTSETGSPIEGVIVTLSTDYHSFGGILESQHTNANGVADFNLPSTMNSGNINVTSRKQNYIPDESFFIYSNDLPQVSLNQSSVSINDYDGNGNGVLNPGETASLSLQIENISGSLIDGSIVASLNSESNYISLSNNENINLGNFTTDNNSLTFGNITVTASNNITDLDDPMLRLTVFSTSDDLLWNYIVPLNFSSAVLDFSYNLDSQLTVGGNSQVSLSINNSGSMSLNNVIAEIALGNDLLEFDSNQFLFDYIGQNQSALSDNQIVFSASTDLINGSVIPVSISLTSDNGFEMQSILSVQVGNVTLNDPVGPDLHGYYIYDMGDTGYQLAPEYDWIEIDPDFGGEGEELDINDGGDNLDDVTTISLPFTFTFYGIDYNEVSVCSNGWISFGETDMTSFRNYTLPGPGGPSPIVAVFWDDLKTTNGGEIYAFHDEQNNSFIIEWSNLRTFLSNTTEAFQIILYNTGNETPTGDDEMKLQYKEFNNNSIGDYPVGNYDGAVIHGQYCTVGIENHSGDDGLQYTFNNSYATGARTLTDQSALFITTRGSIPYAQPQVSYNQQQFTFNVPLNESDAENLIITNSGEIGSNLAYEVSSAPYPVSSNQIDSYGYAYVDSDTVQNIIDYNWIDISNENTVLEFENNDTAVQIDMGFEFPFYSETFSQCLINPNGWIGFEEDNNGWNNQSLFNEDTPNGSIFGFWDDLNPANSGNEVGSGEVKYHTNGQRLVVWFDNVIHWTNVNRIYNFQIVINNNGLIQLNYSNMIGDTESATVGIKSPDGSNGLQVVYNDSYINDNLSVEFNTANWLSVDFVSGNDQLADGTSAIFAINVNTSGMEEGTYNAYVINNTNASVDFDAIPITLNTQGSFLIGDLNQDSVLDIIDVVSLVSIIMGNVDITSLDQLVGDLNGDTFLNVQDIILLVGIILSN